MPESIFTTVRVRKLISSKLSQTPITSVACAHLLTNSARFQIYFLAFSVSLLLVPATYNIFAQPIHPQKKKVVHSHLWKNKFDTATHFKWMITSNFWMITSCWLYSVHLHAKNGLPDKRTRQIRLSLTLAMRTGSGTYRSYIIHTYNFLIGKLHGPSTIQNSG